MKSGAPPTLDGLVLGSKHLPHLSPGDKARDEEEGCAVRILGSIFAIPAEHAHLHASQDGELIHSPRQYSSESIDTGKTMSPGIIVDGSQVPDPTVLSRETD